MATERLGPAEAIGARSTSRIATDARDRPISFVATICHAQETRFTGATKAGDFEVRVTIESVGPLTWHHWYSLPPTVPEPSRTPCFACSMTITPPASATGAPRIGSRFFAFTVAERM